MKNRVMALCAFSLLAVFTALQSAAQSAESQQLILNVEKLSQLKNILSDMKKGYTTLANGYSAVKNIAQGNFTLHETFLDGLMLISPEVRKYRRIPDIIANQKNLVTEYNEAFKNFTSSGLFNSVELKYLSLVYSNLAAGSKDNLDELSMVITSSLLRMSDEERLSAIDRVFTDTQDKLVFIRNFNQQATLLLLQRKRAQAELKTVKKLFNNN